ncbi:hypothetical protein HDV57DRAFT_67760 [Trichoderma longibrachiatum]
MSRRPGLWESHEVAESSTSQVKSERQSRSSLWDNPAASATFGAAAYGPGSTANGRHRAVNDISMSGVGGSSMHEAAPGPSHSNGDVKGKGRAPANSYDMSLLNSGIPPGHPSTRSRPSAPLSGRPIRDLPSFFAPANPGPRSSDSRPSAPFSVPPARDFGSFSTPQYPPYGDHPQALSLQQNLAEQQARIRAVWDNQRRRLEEERADVEELVREENRMIMQFFHDGWNEERGRLKSEITALRKAVKELEDGHLQLCDDHRRLWVENLKLEEENSRLRDALSQPRDATDQAQGGAEGTAVHHHNARPTFTNPFGFASSGQDGRFTMYSGGRGYRGSWTAWSDPTPSASFYAGSSWPVQAPTGVTTRSPPPAAATAAPQGPAVVDLPSEQYVPMSPRPDYGSVISNPVIPLYPDSPTYSPASPTMGRTGSPIPYHPASPDLTRLGSPLPYRPASPNLARPDSPIPFCPASPTPMRSPKRRHSVIDVNEVDAGLDGIPLRANTVRKTTFVEAVSEEVPPLKRQRSLSQESHEYCIVNNLSDDDDEGDEEDEDEDEGRDKEEVRRLKLHAGHTPRSPPVRHSQGSPTPIAPSSPPDHGMAIPDEMATVPPDSTTSEGSGDVPLKGPLMIRNNPLHDESFLAALHEKLNPISRGVDALPRAVQSPIEMPAPLSAARGEHIGIGRSDSDHVPHPESTDRSNLVSTEGKESEDDGDHSDDFESAEPDVPLKFKSTSNFGQPFGRM